MSINWKQIPAFAMARQQSKEMIERLLAAKGIEEKKAYIADYLQKPEDMQCALGYMRCLIESSFAKAFRIRPVLQGGVRAPSRAAHAAPAAFYRLGRPP